MWMPTRLKTGKAARIGKQSTHAPIRSAGVVGTALRKGGPSQSGEAAEKGLATANAVEGRRFQRESERVIRTVEPG